MDVKRYFLGLSFLLIALGASAVMARPDTISYRQSDGTVLRLAQVGDEHLHYFLNVVTGEAMQRNADGDFTVIDQTTLQQRAAKANERRALANAERVKRLPRKSISAHGAQKAEGMNKTYSGTKHALVILVNYTDKQFTYSQSYFNNRFNGDTYTNDGHIGSIRNFFSDQSYGTFDLQFDVVGPVTLSNNMEYYGANDEEGDDIRPRQMVAEAVQLVDSQVNFADYDWDGDGYVDTVFVLFAGYGEAQGGEANTIWPHQWALGTYSKKLDGKIINAYGCTSELTGSSGAVVDGIGTFCHEFSHCLGLPDVYDVDGSKNGSGRGMSYYDLMSSGNYNGPSKKGEVPCGYTCFERFWLGWMDITDLDDSATITGMKSIGEAGEAYAIYNSGWENEFFLLEYRRPTRWYSYFGSNDISGSEDMEGLLIQHVDYDDTAWSNSQINIYSNHQRYTFVVSGMPYNSSSASYYNAIMFPGVFGATEFTDQYYGTLNDGAKLFNMNKIGGYNLNRPVRNITVNSNHTVSFDYGETVRYTVTFNDNGNISTWTQSYYDENITLPNTTGEFTDWVGMGWTSTNFTGTKPSSELTIFNEGQTTALNKDVYLYAVYMNDDYVCTLHPVEADYTITMINAGVTTTWTQNTDRTFTLPAPDSPDPAWTFAGWATSEIEETTIAPEMYVAGTSIRPLEDMTLYAVFSRSVGGNNSRFCLVSAPTAGKEYILAMAGAAGSTLAIDLSKLPTSAANTEATEVTIANYDPLYIDCDNENLVWKFTKSSSDWNVSNGDNKLCINGSGLCYKSTATTLYWDNDGGLYGKTGSNAARYPYITNNKISVKSTADTNGNRAYLYERTGEAAVTYYSTSPVGELYTVTFNEGAGSSTCDTWTQTVAERTVNLPNATIDIDGWSFAGWAFNPIADTTTAPEFLAAGAEFTPEADTELFAVYTTTMYNGAVATAHYATEPTAAPVHVFYTITYHVCGETSTFTQAIGSFTATLPAPAYSDAAWTFAGWANEAVATRQPEAPEMLAESTLTPEANIDLYAVYFNGKAYISNPADYVPGGGVTDPQFYFPHIAKVGGAFQAPKLNTKSNGKLTYSSSNPEVAIVNETTGEVTTLAVGTAIITVTQEATSKFAEGTAKYMIKVEE